MAVIISNGNTSLNTASGFYRVEAYDLSFLSAQVSALTTTQYKNVTFANSGNCLGVILKLTTSGMTDRTVDVSLEQYQTITSVNTSTDRFVKVAHGLNNDDIITFNGTSAAGGTTLGTKYYVINKNADDFQVSLTPSPGSAINLTSSGSSLTVGKQVGASKELTTVEIAGSATSGTYQYRGTYITPFIFTSGYAVDTTASKWRFRIAHGTGTGTWSMADLPYAAWCDTAVSFNDNDTLIVKDKVIVDKTATIAGVSASPGTLSVAVVICSNPGNPGIEDVALMEWQNPPSSAYTLTVAGKIMLFSYGGFRVGNEDRTLTPVTITIATPGVISYSGHGLTDGQAVVFSTTGSLPTGITAGTRYFVVNSTSDNFNIESSVGGGAIATSGSQSGTHTVLHRRRIPTSEKATITFPAPTVGSTEAGFVSGTSSTTIPDAASSYGGLASLFLYGEIPSYQYTTLKSNAVTGQANLVCNDNVDWVNGDSVVAGKQYVQGQGVTTIHSISSVTGDTITLTANLATNDRKSGGSVLKLGGHGILLQNTNAYSINYLFTAANIQVSGVDLYNQQFNTLGTTYYYYLSALNSSYRSQYLFQDVTFWTNSTSCTYLLTSVCPPSGILMNRCYGFRQMPASGCVSYFASGHLSERMTISNGRFLGQYSAYPSSATNIRLTINNCSFENGRASQPFFAITGISGIFTNNSLFGNATTASSGGTVMVRQAINAVISGNSYDYNVVAMSFLGYLTINCIDTDSAFNQSFANTADLVLATDAFPDYSFKSPSGALTFDDTTASGMVPGGKIKFSDYNDTATDDRALFIYGKTQRTNSSLTDTTVHTSGGSALRLEPTSSTNLFEFSFDVPTGNIQNKTMTVAVWAKINNAAYYAGVNTMPTLSVLYDGTTTISSIAGQGTSWQLLSCTFMPTTTTGKIVVTISGLTDASGTDRYFYIDDMSILYPAGYKLDLGSLDIWENALPVFPPIATVMSASDIWALPISGQTGAGTIGNFISKLLTVTKFLGLK